MKKIITLFFLFFITFTLFAQGSLQKQRPKLVVGIVVDQMRYDYLTRFYDKYGEGGFKRLMNGGFNLRNTHYNYIPTYTAVGHASIYSGTTPEKHGVLGNWWYDRYLKKSIYCVDDDSYATVGVNSDKGQKSPYRMHVTTVTDELRLSQNMKGKTIGIAIKDRSSILPAGHTANAAYWFDGGEEGKWITSSFYMDELPNWVQEFNALDKVSEYLSQKWNTLYDINTYTESILDNNPYEESFIGEKKPVFPHDLPKLKKANEGKGLIKKTPFGNSFTTDFAKAAILGEQLGKSEHTDFLAISFSSTDYVGHRFGIDAIETQDTYLRLDKDLESLLDFLDKNVGKENYTLFLTADHAAVQVPAYLESLKIPSGYFDALGLRSYLKNFTKENFGSENLIENISNYQIFLNRAELDSLKLNKAIISKQIAEHLIDFDGIYKVVTAETLQNTNFDSGILELLQNGYNQKLSGDILIITNPAYITRHRMGTTHGSGYNYDTHVPLIFYGKGIKKGNLYRRIAITDIAPTISALLKISFPNGSTGEVIPEVLDQ